MYLFKRVESGLSLLVLLICSSASSQSHFFGEGPIKWDLRKAYEIPAEAEKYSSFDLVILNELTEFYFYSSTSEKIVRSIKYKINTKKGLESIM
jgi:hypothetical protein